MAVSVISQSELEGLWHQNRMPEKRAQGVFTEIIAHSAAASNPAYPGGTSLIIKVLTPRGQHIGTLHEIRMPDGSVSHSHPKAYTLRDCSRVRAQADSPGAGVPAMSQAAAEVVAGVRDAGQDRGMKISVCLSGDDIRFIDEYAESRGEISRSAVIRSAIRLLREEDLGEQYSAAFAEWQEGGEDKVWASVPGDGIEPEPPEAR